MKPSWTVTMFTDAVGRRPPWPNRSREPPIRVARPGSVPRYRARNREPCRGTCRSIRSNRPGTARPRSRPTRCPTARRSASPPRAPDPGQSSRGTTVRVEVAVTSSERRREVEAEPVDVHLLHPVAQRVHHQPESLRLVQVDGVAATGVVDVARAVLGEPVIRRVVDAAKAQRRPDSLPSAVWLNTTSRITSSPAACRPRTISRNSSTWRRRRRSRSNRCAGRSSRSTGSPSSCAARGHELRVMDELVDRKQLDGGHAEPLEVRQGGRMRHPAYVPRSLIGHVRVELGEALDVDL